jgi:uncharacterized protein YktA (UPF0223 family)
MNKLIELSGFDVDDTYWDKRATIGWVKYFLNDMLLKENLIDLAYIDAFNYALGHLASEIKIHEGKDLDDSLEITNAYAAVLSCATLEYMKNNKHILVSSPSFVVNNTYNNNTVAKDHKGSGMVSILTVVGLLINMFTPVGQEVTKDLYEKYKNVVPVTSEDNAIVNDIEFHGNVKIYADTRVDAPSFICDTSKFNVFPLKELDEWCRVLFKDDNCTGFGYVHRTGLEK